MYIKIIGVGRNIYFYYLLRVRRTNYESSFIWSYSNCDCVCDCWNNSELVVEEVQVSENGERT